MEFGSLADRRGQAGAGLVAWPVFCLMILSTDLALSARVPWSYLPFQLGRVAWIAATLAWLVLLAWDAGRARLAVPFARVLRGRAWLPVLAAANAAYLLLNAFYFRRFGYGVPWLGLALCAAAPFALARRPLVTAWLLSVGFLVASILAFPLVTERSDMLPVLRVALDRWHAGGDPYGVLPVTAGTNHMPYLPALFLSHVPAWAAGLDLRWNTVLYRLAWGGLLVRALRDVPRESPLCACAVLFFLNPYLTFRHETYFEFELLVVMTFWTVRRAAWAALALGLFTRQWTWVLAPFLWWARSGPGARGRAAGLAQVVAWAAAWGALLWLALHATTSLASMRIIVSKFQTLVGGASYLGDYGFTLYPLLMALRVDAYAQAIQAVCVLGLFLAAVRADRERAVWLGITALSVFVALNALYWNYFMLELGLWILGFEVWRARGGLGAETDRPGRGSPTRRG